MKNSNNRVVLWHFSSFMTHRLSFIHWNKYFVSKIRFNCVNVTVCIENIESAIHLNSLVKTHGNLENFKIII